MLTSLGILILTTYIPTVYKLFHYRLWREEYSHGPLIFLIFLWLLWKEREIFKKPIDDKLHLPAMLVFFFGLALYWLGVRHKAMSVEIASLPFVFIGAYYSLIGKEARKWIFPALYLVFVIPLPVFIVDMVTFPLKQIVSQLAEKSLALLHYPIFRNGVLLTIGDYKLLVADACSGMRSITSLLALISLYVYLQEAGIPRRMLVLISILPIAVLANTVRVASLALITFHFGESAGQSYYHDFSGFVVFGIALASLMMLDKLVIFLLERKKKPA
ncbi:MAG: exosortase [Candidatus Schekmanbacteria bacterium]|nr:exosortase [Candidatus Schekmanbacteria bacterium]